MPAADSPLSELRQIKLRTLVGDHWTVDGPLEAGGGPGGATLHQVGTGRGWVLVDDGDAASFGAALAWSRRHACRELHVLVEDRGRDASGIVARRAGHFSRPPTVWRVEGRALRPAFPARATLDPPAIDVPTAVLDELAAEIAAHGAVPMIEYGILRGEVLGLEVVRAVPADDGGWRLSVGVGRHDREAREEMRPGEPVGNALDDTVAMVRRRRSSPELRHPANTLARERLLRAVLIAHPELGGAVSLAPVSSPLPVDDLRAPSPAGALGTDCDGAPLVVVCSTGVDVDLVPTAADIRLLHAPDARLVLVLPVIDAYPLTYALAAALQQPAEVRTVAEDWPALLN